MNSTVKQIARERVAVLFEQANRSYKSNPKLAQSYISTARKVAMAARIRFPQQLRRSACKTCNAYLVPGETSRVRLRSRREPHLVVTCLTCGNISRVPLKVKRKVEKKAK